MLHLLLAVALLAVSSLRAVTLLGRRSLVVAGRCGLGRLARGGCSLALAVTLLLVVTRGIALVLLAVATAVTATVAALLLLVVAAAVALLSAIASSVAAAAALSIADNVDERKASVKRTTKDSVLTPADRCMSRNNEPATPHKKIGENPAQMHLPTVASSVASATVTASAVTPVTLQ